jgi:hypothetical protein
MSKYHHPDVLDNGLSRIKTNTQRVALIKNYTAGDSYATVTGNIVAAAAISSGEFTLADQGTLGRKVTLTAKAPTATATSTGTDDLHFALLDDASSKVLAVTDETTNQAVTTGNTVNIPALVFNFNQPV